jgi:hypothetical protein
MEAVNLTSGGQNNTQSLHFLTTLKNLRIQVFWDVMLGQWANSPQHFERKVSDCQAVQE